MGTQINRHDVRFKPNSPLAKVAAKVLSSTNCAMVLGRTIHLHGVSTHTFLQNDAWVKHEMAHVEQFKRYGFFPFLMRYFGYSLRYGYYLNPFEVEARAAEKQ